MPLTYSCPFCRGAVTVPDQVVGQPVMCPHCRQVFQTTPPAAPPVARPQPSANPFDYTQPSPDTDDDEDDRPRSRRPQKPGPAQYLLVALVMAVVIPVCMITVLNRERFGGGVIGNAIVFGIVGGGVGLALGVMRLALGIGQPLKRRYRRK